MIKDRKAMVKNFAIVFGILVVLVLGYVGVVRGYNWDKEFIDPFLNLSNPEDVERVIQAGVEGWAKDNQEGGARRYKNVPTLIGFDNNKVRIEQGTSSNAYVSSVTFSGSNLFMRMNNPSPDVASIEFVDSKGDEKAHLIYTSKEGKKVTIYDGTIDTHGFYKSADGKSSIRVFPELRDYDNVGISSPESYFEEEVTQGSWIKIEEGGKKISFKDARFKVDMDASDSSLGEGERTYAEFSSIEGEEESFVEIEGVNSYFQNANMVIGDRKFTPMNSGERVGLTLSLMGSGKIDFRKDVFLLESGGGVEVYDLNTGKKIAITGMKEGREVLIAYEELTPEQLAKTDGPVVSVSEKGVGVALQGGGGEEKVEVVTSENPPEIVDVDLVAGEKEGKSEVKIKVKDESGEEKTYAEVGGGAGDDDKLRVAKPGSGGGLVAGDKKGVFGELIDGAREDLRESAELSKKVAETLAQLKEQDDVQKETLVVTGPNYIDPTAPPDLVVEAKRIIRDMQRLAGESQVTYETSPFIDETPEQTAALAKPTEPLIAARVRGLLEADVVETPVVETPIETVTPVKTKPEYVEREVVVGHDRKLIGYRWEGIATHGWGPFRNAKKVPVYKDTPITKTIRVLKETSSTTRIQEVIPEVVKEKAVARPQVKTQTPTRRGLFCRLRRWR